MRSLSKNVLAQTFKFDCDRFLRLKLATEKEKTRLKVNDRDLAKYRPGIDLVKEEGIRWETEKYQDLIDLSSPNELIYRLRNEIDPVLKRARFDEITNLFEILRRNELPSLILQPKFLVPQTITPALKKAYEQYKLDPVNVVPDILWIRGRRPETSLINVKSTVEYEIHVIDVKMAAIPNLRHFAEVTFYTLALAEALIQQGLSNKFAVSAEGLIFPGSHDKNEFRQICRDFEARGAADPVAEALEKTLIKVPHEVYQVHVRQFFENRLLRVLAQEVEEAEWHVAPKCQICDYVGFCQQNAKNTDHLSRLAWLSHGQARVLRDNGIQTTTELAEHISKNSPQWQAALNANHQLRAEKAVWLARAEALRTNTVQIAEKRKSALMPAWSNLNIFLTVHSDPGSGITFAVGAKKIYFQPGRATGEKPIEETQTFIVDRSDAMNTDSERERLIELIDCVTGWFQEVLDYNQTVPSRQKLPAHIYFWDSLEIKQLRRMIERHLNDPVVLDKVWLLLRLFPPEKSLPDFELFKSQPGTVVKDVFRTLFGLPIAHDYTLLEVASLFYPWINPEGKPFKVDLPYGFKSELSKDVLALTDQIPFERAYELWRNRIMLKKFDPRYPNNPERWRLYTHAEIFNGLQHAIEVRLNALSNVVWRLRENHRDKLVLKKSGFTAPPITQMQIPEESQQLIVFTKLDIASNEIKNRQERALPVDEREARFISIRGLQRLEGAQATSIIDEIKRQKPDKAHRQMWVMTFSPGSRDAKIKEGDFTLALTNEGSEADLDSRVSDNAGIDKLQLERLLEANGLEPQKAYTPLGRFLQVEVVKLDSISQIPMLVVSPKNPLFFCFAEKINLINFNRPMVLDPVFDDFREGEIVESIMREIGGQPPRRKRNAKKAAN